MEKARLTREQAGLLEEAKKHSRGKVIDLVERQLSGTFNSYYDKLNGWERDTFLRALYVGYEIIEEDQVVTVTENMRDAIRKARNESGYSSEQVLETWLEGFDTALEALGIKL